MIILIDNYDSFTYNLYQIVAEIYPNIQVHRNDQITVKQINALEPKGLILSPGPGQPDNAGICIDLILNKRPEVPLLGVCLGHQALAAAFGGKVISASEIVHGKADLIYHRNENENESLYHNLPTPFKAARYHSLMVERATLSPDFIIEAENQNKLIMGMRHRDLPLYGVQFHPESILTPVGPNLLKNFIRMVLAC